MEHSSIVITDITLNGTQLKSIDSNNEAPVPAVGNKSSIESAAAIEGSVADSSRIDAANDSGDHVTVTLGVSDQPMSKTFKRDANGNVVKEGTPQAAVMQGFAPISFGRMGEFKEIVAGLDNRSYLLYGGSIDDNTTTIGGRRQELYPFQDRPSIMCGDFDAERGSEGKAPEELVAAYKKIFSNLDDFGYIVFTSTSSHIYYGDELVYHRGNCKMYLKVESGTMIPELLQRIADHSWLYGEGFIKLNRTGSMSAEGLVDMAMKTSNQVDYVAGAICKDGLEQRRPEPIVNEGRAFGYADMPPDVSERIKPLIAQAKAAKKPEADQLREKYTIDNQSRGIPMSTTDRALDQLELAHDFELTLSTGVMISVADVFAGLEKYHDAPIYDVFGGHRCDRTKIYTDGPLPVIHTLDDGGQTFKLVDTPNRDKVLKSVPDDKQEEISSYLDLDDIAAKFAEKKVAKELGIPVDDLRQIRSSALEPDEGHGSQLRQFEKQYAYVSSGSKVLDMESLDQGSLAEYELQEFRNAHKHLTDSDGNQVTDKWLRSNKIKRVRATRFAPDRWHEQTFMKGKFEVLNSYIPPKWETTDEPPQTTLDHIDYLFPEPEERAYFLDWNSHMVQNPGCRLPMILMVSTAFGTGRGTLCTVLKGMYGTYASQVDFNKLCGDSPYNDWKTRKLLIIVGETKETNKQSSDMGSRIRAYETLKETIDTAPIRDQEINPKYGKKYTDDIFLNVIASSNDLSPLMLPKGDRRVAVLSNPDEKQCDAYYANLSKVLATEGEARKLWNYFLNRQISASFNPGEPICTYAKQRMEEASLSSSEQLYADVLDLLQGDIATLEQFSKVLEEEVTNPKNHYGSRLDDYAKHAKDQFNKADTLTKDRRAKHKVISGQDGLRPRIIRNQAKWRGCWEANNGSGRADIKAEVTKNG
jgi:hypothetical protein